MACVRVIVEVCDADVKRCRSSGGGEGQGAGSSWALVLAGRGFQYEGLESEHGCRQPDSKVVGDPGCETE